MKYLITDKELLDYVTGQMAPSDRRALESKALKSGETDLLLYAQLADYAATGSATDDIIGEDTFMPEGNIRMGFNFHFSKAADHISPNEDNPLEKKDK